MTNTKQQTEFNGKHLGFISCDINEPINIGDILNGEIIVGIQPFVLLRRFRNDGERIFYKVRVLSNYTFIRREVACTQVEILEVIDLNDYYLNNYVNGIDDSLFYTYKKQDLNFFRENKDSVNWHAISKLPYLTDEFIDEFNEYICYDMVSYYYPNLSVDFVKKYINLMNLDLIKSNEFITTKVKKEIINLFDEEKKRKMFRLL